MQPFGGDVAQRSLKVEHVPLIKLRCVQGPADGALVPIPKDPIIRVPATHVAGVFGVYRLLGGTEATGPRRLRYDYAVEFDHDGERFVCHEVLAGGDRPDLDVTLPASTVIHWVVRVGDRSCDADALRTDDFAPGSDFIGRIMSAADRHGIRVRRSRPIAP
jgi:hypothetical protein